VKTTTSTIPTRAPFEPTVRRGPCPTTPIPYTPTTYGGTHSILPLGCMILNHALFALPAFTCFDCLLLQHIPATLTTVTCIPAHATTPHCTHYAPLPQLLGDAFLMHPTPRTSTPAFFPFYTAAFVHVRWAVVTLTQIGLPPPPPWPNNATGALPHTTGRTLAPRVAPGAFWRDRPAFQRAMDNTHEQDGDRTFFTDLSSVVGLDVVTTPRLDVYPHRTYFHHLQPTPLPLVHRTVCPDQATTTYFLPPPEDLDWTPHSHSPRWTT